MKRVLLVIFIIICFILLDGFYLNPKGYKIVEKEIAMSDLPESFENFKIVQISDILLGSTKSSHDILKMSDKINDLKPDIIVFTGDIISNGYNASSDEINDLKEFFKSLNASMYKYAAIGDNDQSTIETFQEIMKYGEFQILDNESTYLFYKSNIPIKITGLTNDEKIATAFNTDEGIDSTFNLVITHYPDFIDKLSDKSNLVILAGHSLKGQIRIPFFGGLIKKDNARKFLDDYYEIENNKLYISGGLGTEKIKFRFSNKPEINVYRLKIAF